MPLLIALLLKTHLLIGLGSAVRDNVVKVGVLSDSSVVQQSSSQITCASEWLGIPVRVEKENRIYQSGNRTALLKIAKDFSDREVDIVIGYMPIIELGYLHRAFHGDLRLSIVPNLDVGEQLWYLSLQNNTSSCDLPAQLARNECSNKRHVARFLADVVNKLGWSYLSLLYGLEYEQEASIITDLVSEAGVRVNQHSIKSEQSSLPILDLTYHTTKNRWKQYLLMADWESVETMFDELNVYDAPGLGPTAMKTFSLWLVWGQNVTSDKLTQKVSNISNVALLERPGCPDEGPFPVRPYLWRSLQPEICDFIEASLNDTTNCTFPDEQYKDISRIYNGIWTSISSDYSPVPLFKLSTAFWHQEYRRFETVYEGIGDELSVSERDMFPNTRYGLNKMHLVVTTLPWPLYTIKHSNSDGSVHYEGLSMDLLQAMSRKLNFSFTIREPLDQEWGRKLLGNWTGLIGDVFYGKADLIYAPISVSIERKEAIDFTTPFNTDYNIIVTKMPDREKSRWMLLLRPLTWPVLVTIACIFPSVTLSLWLCEKFSPFYDAKRARAGKSRLRFFGESTWYMIGALFARSGTFLPKANSGRTILTFWWLFIVLLVATYCGNLMAFLTVIRDKKPFNTIVELTSLHHYKWGTNDGTYLSEWLKNSTHADYQKLWRGIERFSVHDPWVLHQNYSVHMAELDKGNYAYMTDETTIEMATVKDCSLVQADETFLMLQYCVGLSNNSAYRSMFTESVTSMIEAGLVEMWEKKWLPKFPPCPAFLMTAARRIMLTDIQSSFYILLGGIVLSASVLMLEFSLLKRDRPNG